MDVKLVLPVVLAVSLVTPHVAVAKSPKRAPRATVVKIMSESSQALVYDRNRGEYVVVKRGDTMAGYVVSEIDKDQIVLTTPTDPPMHYVLPLVPNAKISKSAPTIASTSADSPSGVRDPYADAGRSSDVRDPYGGSSPDSASGSDVLDPYGANETVPSVIAPEGSRVGTPAPTDTIPKSPAPVKARPEANSVRDPYGSSAKTTPAPSSVRDPYGASSKKAAPTGAKSSKSAAADNRKLSRSDFDSALSDFHARSKEVQLSLEKNGIRIKSISKGSFVARLGLRENDLILTIAGHKIRNADEAAIVYVELSDARSFDIVVLRDGSKHTIHYTFVK